MILKLYIKKPTRNVRPPPRVALSIARRSTVSITNGLFGVEFLVPLCLVKGALMLVVLGSGGGLMV